MIRRPLRTRFWDEEPGSRVRRKMPVPPISPQGYVHPAYGKRCQVCGANRKVRPTPGRYYPDLGTGRRSEWTCDDCYDNLLPVVYKPEVKK